MAARKRLKSKVCLVGEIAVGKTSLIRRYVQNMFDDRYIMTIGTKVTKRTVDLAAVRDGVDVTLDMTVWDIMGEKGFRQLLKEAYFYGAQGVLAVCDLTRPTTLEDLDDWVTSVFKVAGELPVVYAVNKLDLRDEVMILFGQKEIEEHAKAFAAPWMYTSARTGENVEASFRALGEKIVRAPVA